MEAAILLIMLIAGCVIGTHIGIMAIWIGIVLLILLRLIAFRFAKDLRYIVLKEHLLSISAYLLVIVIGIADASLRNQPEFNPRPDKEYKICGTITQRRTLASSEMYKIQIKSVDGDKRSGNLILFLNPSEIFEPGEEILFRSEFEGMDDSEERVKWPKAIIDRDSEIKLIKKANFIKHTFYTLAGDIAVKIEKTKLSRDSKAILKALILGDRGEISQDKISLFRNAGVIHILALSGMHIGIIAGIIMWLTLPLNLISGRRYRFLIVILAVWFFVMLTGGAYSTIRAGFMITITMLAMILDRQRDPFSICCFSAFFMILIWPNVIYDVGFQLSFLCVMMLTLLAEPLNPISHRKNPKLYKVFALVTTTVIATASTWILTAYHFGTASVSFLPANLIILPLLPIYLIAGLSYIILDSLGADLIILKSGLDLIPDYAYKILEFCGSPQLDIRIGWITLTLWIGALFCLGISMRKYRYIYALPGNMKVPEQRIDMKWFIISIAAFLTSIAMMALHL